MRRLFALFTLVAVTALAAASTAGAGREVQMLTCGGGLGTIPVTVTTTNNDHSVAWGVGTVSGGFHGIPVSFTGTATDLTTGALLDSFSFSQSKGNGNGMHNQPTVDCSTPPDTATAGELGGIPGIADSDLIQFAFTATVVLKP